MEQFSITSRLTPAAYAKVFLIGLYKRPVFILTTLVGIFVLISPFLFERSELELYEIVIGCFLILAPILIWLMAVNQFMKNPSFKQDITYTFNNNGVTVKGQTFKGEFIWTHVTKQKELDEFLILYHAEKAGNFIDKTKLTQEQLEFIKGKVGRK